MCVLGVDGEKKIGGCDRYGCHIRWWGEVFDKQGKMKFYAIKVGSTEVPTSRNVPR